MGWLDVDAMLSEMSPGQFNERLAHYLVEPWGCEVQLASEIGAAIINKITTAASSEVTEGDLLKPDHFVPKRDEGDEPPAQQSYVQGMRQRIGV